MISTGEELLLGDPGIREVSSWGSACQERICCRLKVDQKMAMGRSGQAATLAFALALVSARTSWPGRGGRLLLC